MEVKADNMETVKVEVIDISDEEELTAVCEICQREVKLKDCVEHSKIHSFAAELAQDIKSEVDVKLAPPDHETELLRLRAKSVDSFDSGVVCSPLASPSHSSQYSTVSSETEKKPSEPEKKLEIERRTPPPPYPLTALFNTVESIQPTTITHSSEYSVVGYPYQQNTYSNSQPAPSTRYHPYQQPSESSYRHKTSDHNNSFNSSNKQFPTTGVYGPQQSQPSSELPKEFNGPRLETREYHLQKSQEFHLKFIYHHKQQRQFGEHFTFLKYNDPSDKLSIQKAEKYSIFHNTKAQKYYKQYVFHNQRYQHLQQHALSSQNMVSNQRGSQQVMAVNAGNNNNSVGQSAQSVNCSNFVYQNVTAGNLVEQNVNAGNFESQNVNAGNFVSQNVNAGNFVSQNVNAGNFVSQNQQSSYTPQAKFIPQTGQNTGEYELRIQEVPNPMYNNASENIQQDVSQYVSVHQYQGTQQQNSPQQQSALQQQQQSPVQNQQPQLSQQQYERHQSGGSVHFSKLNPQQQYHASQYVQQENLTQASKFQQIAEAGRQYQQNVQDQRCQSVISTEMSQVAGNSNIHSASQSNPQNYSVVGNNNNFVNPTPNSHSTSPQIPSASQNLNQNSAWAVPTTQQQSSTTSSNATEVPFPIHCKFCDKNFGKEVTFYKHLETVHNVKEGKVKVGKHCHICGKIHYSARGFASHLQHHHNYNSYEEIQKYARCQCWKCKEIFDELDTLKLHLTTCHNTG